MEHLLSFYTGFLIGSAAHHIVLIAWTGYHYIRLRRLRKQYRT